MDLITLDAETYYDKGYSLSKMTTEEYIRDPQFQVIGVATKVNDGPTTWVSGPAAEVLTHLRSLPWDNAMLLAQNTMFDGAILTWRCGIRPKAMADTMLMSRALFGTEVSHGLKALAERYGVGEKGTEVLRAIGKRRSDFSPEELARYGQYCKTDVDLTYDIFQRMLRDGFPKRELKLIDITLRMFTDPVLELDRAHLEKHLRNIKTRKQDLLDSAGVTDKKDLMSNNKFADMLRSYGVEPPTKISPATGKTTYAFAKTDEEFAALQDHDVPAVAALVSTRLGVKSTLEETRTERFIGIASRGNLPVPIRYCAAHTHRWGGADKINLQNLPSRGPDGKQIKKSIIAPAGYVLIDADSSQIEARVLAWVAEQEDMIETFWQNNAEIASGVPKAEMRNDPYKRMASQIYNIDVGEVDGTQRQVGKVVVLGAGYGVGHLKLQAFLKTQAGVEVSEAEARRIIDVYRRTNHKISQLWRDAGSMLKHLSMGRAMQFGRPGCITVDADEEGMQMPSGLYIRYPDLRGSPGERGIEYTYKVRNGRKYIYGGKCVENLTQSIARCVVGEQMIQIAKRYRPVLTVHDSVVCCVREDEAEEAQAYIESCMRWKPDWADGLPVNCESEIGRSYGG